MVTGWPLLTPWAQRGSIFLKALTLTSYFLAFTGIIPKVPGIFQSGTLLLYLMSSQKHPMKDTDLKHLALKAAFLLALASGKRCSEIHTWIANKVSILALFPSSDFLATNQLAREGSQSVSPVIITALTTIVDRQFKEDRTLCPVQALRYYLDRTKDLRGSRSLLFYFLHKRSYLRHHTYYSLLLVITTILLSYKQANQQSLDLVQVKAHGIGAFVASKAFYSGVSVDQIIQACHWKAHNTFTSFFLEDLTWSDNGNNMYLGPVVAAQQVLDPSPQTSHYRKKRSLQVQVFRSLILGSRCMTTSSGCLVRFFYLLFH